MMILSVDPSRAGDGELAEGEREHLARLAARFSREDLMRAFDLLGKAEQEIRQSSQPRYYFEMALLRWMHLRKLVPLMDLLDASGVGPKLSPVGPAATPVGPRPSAVGPTQTHVGPKTAAVGPKASPVGPGPTTAKPSPGPTSVSSGPKNVSTGPTREEPSGPTVGADAGLKDKFLAEVRAGKGFFYNTVVAQAQRIDVTADRIAFSFLPTHRALREQFDQTKAWLEAAAEKVAGRKIAVSAVQAEGAAAPPAAAEPAPAETKRQTAPAGKRDLKAEAESSSAVQAVLEIIPGNIRDVEEM
jgi:DNA polymerase-3 subunit gamma/tau